MWLCVHGRFKALGGGYAALPGTQSVPRSEIMALILVLASVCRDAPLELVTDAQTVCDTILDGYGGRWRISDIVYFWTVFWAYFRPRLIKPKVRWVKAHADTNYEFVKKYGLSHANHAGRR